MAQAVKISTEIATEGRIAAKALKRSLAGQIEYWAKIGKIAEENPDMTFEFIRNILIAKQEVLQNKVSDYKLEI